MIKDPIIIIGTGMAGYSLAREFRKLDKSSKLILISADDGASYSKPMLSNALDKGKTAETLVIASAEKMASDLDATVLTRTRVIKIDPATQILHTDSRETLRYSKLVLASGASPVRLPFADAFPDHIYSVNSLDDYAKFRDALKPGMQVAIIGPGLIGCEFANDLVIGGYHPTVIGPDAWPLASLLPKEVGEFVQQQLQLAGVKWQLNTTVEAIEASGEKVKLQLSSGETLLADRVLSAIGLRANISLAQHAGLNTQRAVVVNQYLQSSNEHIFALGDCAEVQGLWLPFVMPLMNSARALARTLAGETTAVSYPAMPVAVKTPACPLVVSPPALASTGQWQVTAMDNGVRATFNDTAGELKGFALAGTAVAEKQALTKVLPGVMN